MAMDKTNNLTAFLTNTADAIRTAEGSTNAIDPQDFEDKIIALKLSSQTSDADATAGQILKGKTAYVKGEKVTGTIETKTSSNLSASGATVTVPSGYYASQATKSVKTATRGTTTISVTADDTNDKLTITGSNTQPEGYNSDTAAKTASTVVTLTASGKTITATATDGTKISKDVTSGSATTPATIVSVTPSISIDSTGKITASASGSKSVTPTVSAGYVSSGTAGTITVSGSNTKQLTTKGATVITPSTSTQTAVAAGVYTTGAVTVAAIPSTYVKPTTTKSATTYTPTTTNQTIAAGTYCTGAQTIKGDSNLVASNIKSGTSIFGVTGTYTGGGGVVGKDVEWVMLTVGPSWDSKEISGCLFAGSYAYPTELTTANVANYQPFFHSLYDLPSGWYSNSSYNNIFVPKNSYITIWTMSTTALDYSSSTILTSCTGSSAGNFKKQELYTGGPIYYGYAYKVTGSGII